MALTEYRQKRDFAKTKEPKGRKFLRKRKAKELSFVVQKHDASRLHYDFRLEFDGVLKSWSVPKGPSLDPRDKRLAVEVEDHPLDYASFEGVIPAGQYGGGDVIVWDRGTWESESGDIADALKKGHLKFSLKGEKLGGSWALVRTSLPARKPQWLLIKHKDEFAKAHENYDVVAENPESVKTGRLLPRDEGKERVNPRAGGKKKPRSSRASSNRNSRNTQAPPLKARSGFTKSNSTAIGRS